MLQSFSGLKRGANFAVLLAAVVLLNACAFSPGMKFSPDEPVDPANPETVPTIIPITLDSIRRSNQQFELQKPPEESSVSQLLGDATPYRVGAGDVLSIVVWDHPELVLPTQTYNIGGASFQLPTSGAGSTPQGYVVSANGTLQFPYAGAVPVGGLTDVEIQALITKRLAKVINDPQVTVRVTGYRSQKVYIEGQVKNPGIMPISDVPATLAEALNFAGGIVQQTGDPAHVVLSRNGQNYSINIPQLLKQGVDPGRVLLKNGDLISVAAREENKVFVVGEVSRPLSVTLRNGSLTLNEALGDAGGVNPLSSDPRQIYVIRYDKTSEVPVVYHLDGQSPTALALAEQFQLRRRDVVYVDSAAIVRWNRFLSNLLPGVNTGIAGTRLTQQ